MPNSYADLAARVDALEERLRPAHGPAPATSDDRFWILEGLRTRQQRAVVYSGIVETPGGGPVEWQMGHEAADLLGQEWADLAPGLGALGHPVRLKILQLIATDRATTAADLARTDGLGTTGQIYHHLRQLVSAGWLRSTTKGRHQVPPERVVPLLVVLGASR